MTQRDVALVITSCNRFDLLEDTLRSFFAFNTYPIKQHIIVEDSHNIAKLRATLAKFPGVDFTVLHNDPQLGQMKSIDRAYAEVRCDYIFHCEDDWEFYRKGFIEDSFKVLDSDEKIVTVWLREQDDTNGHPVAPEIYKTADAEALPYQLMITHHRKHEKADLWHGFTFNPGLRRLKDYQLVAPISSYSGERTLSEAYFSHGFRGAIFPKGYVRHIGDHRGIRYKLTTPLWVKDLSVSFRRLRRKLAALVGR
ncbi:glycosyltransferase family 2 protein [Shewanella litorisediminis]|uniref:Glycosyltransferase n=1 Tax=Shewanella litorisediminis TaxID=1173586 RepID=A0ABX7G3W2_9GAMM|nr:glycosyltransferase [Shewanella litorisediminis]MCL2919424.1 glycosyltransferase [Shewanella litorisediminis]QRH01962.1 glycosyltransferase [Shewanella litorisediminis]